MKEKKINKEQLNEQALYYNLINKGFSKFEAKEIAKRTIEVLDKITNKNT